LLSYGIAWAPPVADFWCEFRKIIALKERSTWVGIYIVIVVHLYESLWAMAACQKKRLIGFIFIDSN
jgi:hypothetical protein